MVPSGLFWSKGGYVDQRQNAVTAIVCTVPRIRRSRSLSVAKYQPNRTTMASPMKNVSAGVIGFLMFDFGYSLCSLLHRFRWRAVVSAKAATFYQVTPL